MSGLNYSAKVVMMSVANEVLTMCRRGGELLRKALLVRTSIVLRCAVILVGRTIVVLLYCLLVRTSIVSVVVQLCWWAELALCCILLLFCLCCVAVLLCWWAQRALCCVVLLFWWTEQVLCCCVGGHNERWATMIKDGGSATKSTVTAPPTREMQVQSCTQFGRK